MSTSDMPDDMPDFENMSLEDSMKFLESLARKQGANEEEFLTSADMDIADVDASTVVDEPGYTPFGEKPQPKEEKPAAAAPPPPPPAPEPEPPAAAPPPSPAASPEPAAEMDFENMSLEDSMKFLESLARKQGANEEEFLTSADMTIEDVDADTVLDEPGYTPFGEKPQPKEEKPAAVAPPPPPPPTPEPPAAPEPAPAASGGLDWLSGLANDTGGAADLPDLGDLDNLGDLGDLDSLGDLGNLGDLDALTADMGLDAPAGGDNDAMSWLEGLASSQPAPEPEPPAAPPPPPPAPEPTSTGEITNPLDSGMDPMEWLESLARNQGVKDEELLTSANMAVPKSPPGAVDDTPGYEAYNVDNEGVSEPAEEPVLDATDPNAWLGGLSEPADEVVDASDPAAWLGDLANDPSVAGRVPGFDPNPAPVSDDTPSTGDSIADRLNRGETPSPEEMEAWMSGKMDELFTKPPLPIDEDTPADEPAFDPDAPAVAGEMPDWLTGMAPPADAAESAESAFTFEPDAVTSEDASDQSIMADLFADQMEGSAVEPETQTTGMPDMPDWLAEAPTGSGEPSPLLADSPVPDAPAEMPDWLMEDIVPGGETLDIFDTGEAEIEVESTSDVVIETGPLDAELVARFTPEGGDFEDDSWVQAIKEEQRYNYDTSSLPEWYEERIQDPEIRAKFEAMEAERLTVAELPDETTLPKGQREPLPDWLAVATGDAPAATAQEVPAAATGEALPAWLAEDVPGDEPEPVPAADLPDWLSEADTDDVSPADIPAWLTETLTDEDEEPAAALFTPPAPAPQAAPPPPQPAPVYTPPAQAQSPVPVPAAAQIDVAAALSDAQQRHSSGDIDGALVAYEQVVRANAQLDAVEAAVSQIIGQKEHKENAAAYRVLGDAMMRQGKLQAALDTYRKALNLL